MNFRKDEELVGPEDERVERDPWAIKLFRSSPLKQKKYQEISAMLPANLTGLRCLDVGADNGVISYLLRKKGGFWSSTDLTEESVESIRQLVGDEVYPIEDGKLTLSDRSFDLIVIVDLLEHLDKDKAFVEEMARLIELGGTFIVNVPNPYEGLLRKFRFWLGQTDEQHGHLRPGYTPEALKKLLLPEFFIEEQKSYSRFFSQFVDTLILFGLMLLKAGKEGKKGTVVTAESFQKRKKEFFIFSLIAPFLKAAVWLDNLIPFTHGNMLIVKAKRRAE